MSIATVDLLIQGARRDDVFAWLSEPDHHVALLEGAFDGVQRDDQRRWSLQLSTPPRTRTMGYHLIGPDDSHGGRRVLVETTGRRTTGKLHYSLRTMKPSTNTLVTLRMDYDPGSMLGMLVNRVQLGEKLERCLAAVLANLDRELPR